MGHPISSSSHVSDGSISGSSDKLVSEDSDEPASKGSNELVVNVNSHTGEPETGFDPLLGWGCGHVNFEPLIQSTLFKSADDGSIINDLATNYSVSSDGNTWTVHIRDDVRFTDGENLTAEDVAFTFNTAIGSNSELDMSNLEKATAINNTAVEFKLKEPQSSFIWRLRYVGIVPEHAYKKETYGANPIGSGPYKLVEWDKGQQAILELNENYYGKKPYFKKITMLFLDKDTAFAAVKSGDVDIAEIEISHANQTVDGYKLVDLPAAKAQGLSFPLQYNTGKKSLKGDPIGNNVTADITIRKALNIGIDRKALLDGVIYGKGAVEYTGVDQRDFGNPDAKINDSSPEEAKKILENAGWKDTDGDGIREKNGTEAEFKLYYSATDQTRQALSVAVSEQAKELGIKIDLVGASWDEIYANQYSSAVLYAYSSIDTFNLYQQYHSKEADDTYRNPGLYNNSIVDGYLETALRSTDQDQATKYWKLAAYDGSTGFGPAGDATWLWLVTIDYLYMADETLDMVTPQRNAGADVLGNIYEWKRVDTASSTSK
ncbi:ABC transporter substrate-binding protein [Methanosarcina sp.]|uniref:ABC transporter substrate-binding protein n=1 Tax=Methanosarcina sp. TaxID=2213 RepID=UPI0029894402|nr:ABC transporter substrate-binding protein [Methanosarcina sp.]MDW5551375.1 ABC transporter substrate-binding protein [Methanosarcina sp.]MDW5555224.1 ABC transporter substrate-binding protein [Methanosarcina sp.]MDW5560962.1 ABC transporter substrate-binding protein [Methanosarcina sp.]